MATVEIPAPAAAGGGGGGAADVTADRGMLYGAALTWVTAATLTVGTAGETSVVRDSTNSLSMAFLGTLALDITTSGAGGLDTGVEAANTWYAVHIIGDTTAANAPAALLSTSATAPTLPAGYDVFRRVGWVRNDASSNFRPFYQRGNGTTRRYYNDDTLTNLQAVNAANNTTFSTAALGAFMPSTSKWVNLSVSYFADDREYCVFRTTGSTLTEATTVYRISSPENNLRDFRVRMEMPTDASQQIDYAVANASDTLSLYVVGYEDEI